MADFEFWADRGGTFTDIVVKLPDGKLEILKLLSNDPEKYEDAIVEGVRRVLQTHSLSFESVSSLKIGTTVATNALLERAGTKTLLVTTRGFSDVLLIGDQSRAELFNLEIIKPQQIYDEVIEIDERCASDGRIIHSPSELSSEKIQQFRKTLSDLKTKGFRSVAISFLNSYLNGLHEKLIGEEFRKAGFDNVILSHESRPLIRYLPRSQSAVLDAYLTPEIGKYTESLSLKFPESKLKFMQSSGGVCERNAFRGKNSLFSGPAGGYVAALKVAELEGISKIITFDMGGTSTDVAHYSGSVERDDHRLINGISVHSPSLSIHTIAAGGGSVVHSDGERLTVGPDSAGSDPGPCSYGKGGPLTITDCNLLSGRINADFFPRIFGSDSNESLDKNLTETVFFEKFHTSDRVLDFLDLAVENMAGAIHQISTKKGIDPRDYTLFCFGGAGAQLVCPLAEKSSMNRIYIHSLSGVFSALGMGLADESVISERSLIENLREVEVGVLDGIFNELFADAKLKFQNKDQQNLRQKRMVKLRYVGTDTELLVDLSDREIMRRQFESLHESSFGFIHVEREIILESVFLETFLSVDCVDLRIQNSKEARNTPCGKTKIRFRQGLLDTEIYLSENLNSDFKANGPIQIIEPHTTIVVDPGWEIRKTSGGSFIISKEGHEKGLAKAYETSQMDPFFMEIFNNRFRNIAEEMGIVLQKTSVSVNIRERLDYSCALFNAKGELISNAPHIPVHLGSMGESVKSVMEKFNGEISPGDSFLLNSPYHGGTHLPDMTLVSPYMNQGGEIEFFLASRGHHPDIGGRTPGSMPAFSKDISEEGVLIRPVKITEEGMLDEAKLTKILASGEFPARNPLGNITDIRAMLGANRRGISEIKRLLSDYPFEFVNFYMDGILDYSSSQVEKVLNSMKVQSETLYSLDSGEKILVKIQKKSGKFVLDFTGTSAQGPHNRNSPLSVTRAVILYVLRSLIDKDIPLNDGCLRSVEIRVPEGSILNASEPSAVVAGNVETSQALANTLLMAFGVQAASQGTMNNLLFGNENTQYYETICGGSGAGYDFRDMRTYGGADAVQTHMTNSRITDIEILESRFPVRIRSFSVRKREKEIPADIEPGGKGVKREFEFLENLEVSLLSSHRMLPPPGLPNGNSGENGRNTLFRKTKNGFQTIALKGFEEFSVFPGDRLVLETPGGGGVSRRAFYES